MKAIGPDTWGPPGWKFIHYVTLGYPFNPSQEDKLKYKNFLLSLQDVIPCIICANNYKKHLLEYPLNDLVLSSKLNLIHWGIDMHNAVNKINHKKIYKYDEGIEEIIKNLGIKTKSNDLLWIILIIVIISGFLLYNYCKKKNNT